MKNIILLFLFCFIAAVEVSAQNKKTKSLPTNVSGQISPAPQKGHFILQHHGRADTVLVAADGTFKMAIEQQDANYYTVVLGKQSLGIYLLPMDNLVMKLNGNLPSNNPVFEGSSSAYCTYLLQQKVHDKTNANFGRMGTMDPKTFMREMDSTENVMTTLLEIENAKHKFISPFVSAEKSAIQYAQANAYLLYKYQSEEAKKTDLPEKIGVKTYSGDLNNEAMRYHDAFQSYATNVVNYNANLKYVLSANKDYVHYCELKIEEVCSGIKSQLNRDVVFQGVMNQILQDAGSQDIRVAVSKFNACCTNEELKAKVRMIQSQYTSLYPGEVAPDAVCFDSTGQTIRLSDLRGKVVYIDTWATWCGPCKREIPELKKLESEFHGKNVEFISISTDQNIDTWKSFINKQEMSGKQFHQSEKVEESVSKLYMVNSIPRFIIINEEGKIVSADAPRPSSGAQVRDILNTILAD